MRTYLLFFLFTASFQAQSCDMFIFFDEKKESISLALSGSPSDCPHPSEKEVRIMKKNFCQHRLKEIRLREEAGGQKASEPSLLKACILLNE